MRLAAPLLVALTLACGGGGSGGGNETPPTGVITLENARVVASQVAAAIVVAGEIATSSGHHFGRPFGSSGAGLAAAGAGGCSFLPIAPGWSPCDGPDVIEQPCGVSGSIRLTPNELREDRATADGHNLAEYMGCGWGDGTLLYGRLESKGRSWNTLTTFGHAAEVLYGGFTVSRPGIEVQIDGLLRHAADMRWPTREVRISGKSLVLDIRGESIELGGFELTFVRDADRDVYAIDAGGRLASAAFAGEVVYDVDTPLEGDAGAYPVGGVVTIRGASDASIVLFVRDGWIDVEVDLGGPVDVEPIEWPGAL